MTLPLILDNIELIPAPSVVDAIPAGYRGTTYVDGKLMWVVYKVPEERQVLLMERLINGDFELTSERPKGVPSDMVVFNGTLMWIMDRRKHVSRDD